MIGLEGWAVEVKRAAKPLLSQWWGQALEQAQRTQQRPVLLYRLDRKDWRAVVAMADFLPGFQDQPRALEQTAEMSMAAFAAVVRGNMAGAAQ